MVPATPILALLGMLGIQGFASGHSCVQGHDATMTHPVYVCIFACLYLYAWMSWPCSTLIYFRDCCGLFQIVLRAYFNICILDYYSSPMFLTSVNTSKYIVKVIQGLCYTSLKAACYSFGEFMLFISRLLLNLRSRRCASGWNAHIKCMHYVYV